MKHLFLMIFAALCLTTQKVHSQMVPPVRVTIQVYDTTPDKSNFKNIVEEMFPGYSITPAFVDYRQLRIGLEVPLNSTDIRLLHSQLNMLFTRNAGLREIGPFEYFYSSPTRQFGVRVQFHLTPEMSQAVLENSVRDHVFRGFETRFGQYYVAKYISQSYEGAARRVAQRQAALFKALGARILQINPNHLNHHLMQGSFIFVADNQTLLKVLSLPLPSNYVRSEFYEYRTENEPNFSPIMYSEKVACANLFL